MRSSLWVRRWVPAATLAIAMVGATALPALAQATTSPEAFGGEVNVRVGATVTSVGPLPVATLANPNASAASLTAANIVTTGALTAAVTQDPATGVQTATATADDLAVLLTGVALDATSVQATCNAAPGAAIAGSATLTNATLNGTAVTASPPPNTALTIGNALDNVVKITLNEQVTNADGSLTVNAIHIHLLAGAGSLGIGDIHISSATCGPATLPVPLASGLGLGLGLGGAGLVGVLAVAARVTRTRRRSLIDV
jgi:hypothetical protein